MHKIYTNSNWLKSIKDGLTLSSFQKAVLLGTLLGDGYLRASRSSSSARLQICHSTKAKEYLFWLMSVFDNFVFAQPDYQRSNHSLRFTTISHQDFLFYQKLLYRNKIKIIPENIGKYLINPVSIAVWFMDDGNGYLNKNAYRISTYAFNHNDNKILQTCLYSNFGLHTNLVRDKKGFQIYFPSKGNNSDKFKELIKPFILN